MWRLIDNEQGMTLAEMLAAAAIMGIGLVGLASAIPLAGYGIQEGNQLSTATFLANQRLEQVRAARWESAGSMIDKVGVSASPTAPPMVGTTTTFPDEAPMAAPNSDYNRQVRIINCAVGGCAGVTDPDLRQVIVTVDYRPMTGTGVSNQRKRATVSMFLSRR